MQLGMIGLGRMGANMVRRLMRDGHDCVVYDVNADAVDALEKEGADGARSMETFAQKLTPPRAAWVMVPAAVTEQTVMEYAKYAAAGDIVVNGGNSYFHDDIALAKELDPLGIHYVDAGTSGGVWGLDRGYCLMVGGEADVVGHLAPIFESIAPGVDSAARTPGRTGAPSPSEQGWYRCGPVGAGHFVKMVHNGIEYGIMAAYAEGLNILKNANQVDRHRDTDAETAPLIDANLRFDIDVSEVAELWRRGSVIGSWLLDLTAQALLGDADLSDFEGRVSDSGEGRWTALAAIAAGVPAPVLTAALYGRFASRGNDLYANKVESAQRFEFGGHHEKPGGDA
ncbi:MAG: decarboxylating 6-phosphogluconate dehydrogenase [Acidimicrobiia bacterium]|nr:decarboxylating 6-phosphogluconate dehydrogenase [Acidimicrobiia bacterium]